jgi:hypothetical protein
MAASNPATTNGRKMMKNHLKEDKKILKARVKLEKKDLKNNQAHARDHAVAAVQNRSAISKYTSQIKNKGKSSGSSGGSGGR